MHVAALTTRCLTTAEDISHSARPPVYQLQTATCPFTMRTANACLYMISLNPPTITEPSPPPINTI
jgi:hypothetical protein